MRKASIFLEILCLLFQYITLYIPKAGQLALYINIRGIDKQCSQETILTKNKKKKLKDSGAKPIVSLDKPYKHYSTNKQTEKLTN